MWAWHVKMATQNLLKFTRQRIVYSFLKFRVNIYRTQVRSLGMLVTNSLTNSLLFSKLDWCDPCVWRCQLKTCWDCYYCSCWWWESCWQQVQIWKVKFGHIVKFLFTLITRFQGLVKILKLKFCHYYATEAWLWLWSFVEMLMFGWDF